MTFADSDFITLDQAAAIVPGFDKDALKRLKRRDILTVYKPGKEYLTTAADVREAVLKCRVMPKAQDSGSGKRATTPPESLPTPQPGLSLTELANTALNLAMMPPQGKKKLP